MNSYVTKGIVLGRTKFGEADHIITFLTPSHGKVKAIAKGVRKPKSKLAAGSQLFSINDLKLLVGKGEIQTLMSARSTISFGNIVKAAERIHVAYEAISLINKATEEHPEEAYFNLLKQVLESVNDSDQNPDIVAFWFNLQLLKLAGHTIDLRNDAAGAKLAPAASYDFDPEAMRFAAKNTKQGTYSIDDIKFLRLGFSVTMPDVLYKIQDAPNIASRLNPLIQSVLKSFLRV